ncbi:MAG: hypothetical protein JWP13_793 [Candidatus Saccharibacteria bacterium]|nr:hypothetical protein [Candidatus Saccharibacteria bacterium]
MKRLPQNISLLAVSVFAVGILAVAPVSARNGDDDTATTTSVESESSSGSGSSGSGRDAQRVRSTDEDSVSHTEVEHEDGHRSGDDHPTTRTSDLKERAQKLLAAERQDKKGKSVEARQKSCEARKDSLVKKGSNYSRSATRHLEVFNGIYTKVQAFQEEKNLNVANYDALKATADAKKVAADSAVKALSEFDVAIDCTADDPAAAVATLKTTVKNAKGALHEYRVAIKDLVAALRTAADSEEDNSASTEAN